MRCDPNSWPKSIPGIHISAVAWRCSMGVRLAGLLVAVASTVMSNHLGQGFSGSVSPAPVYLQQQLTVQPECTEGLAWLWALHCTVWSFRCPDTVAEDSFFLTTVAVPSLDSGHCNVFRLSRCPTPCVAVAMAVLGSQSLFGSSSPYTCANGLGPSHAPTALFP